MNNELVRVEGLKKHFFLRRGFFAKNKNVVKAVDDVTFSIEKGETLGIVGESGCGKSTMGKLILRLLDTTSGNVFFKGENLINKPSKELLVMRRNFQMVFQNPYGSLNTRMSLQDILEEPLIIHGFHSTKRKKRIRELLDFVGLSYTYVNRFPHEFSGGQRQRIAIARALALNPEFIVADEPVSALDVSIQAQILNLLLDLQKELNLTYLFIAHDLSVVQYISDRIGVMYLGKIVEITDSDNLYRNPLHPYTQVLLSAIPVVFPEETSKRKILKGDIPRFINTPGGCGFSSRCDEKKGICMKVEPILQEYMPGHFVACHLYSSQ